MVRESDGFACRSDDERRRLVDAAAAFNALGVDGIVVGWIRERAVDEETLARVLDAAAANATFHRAFDSIADPEAGLRVLQRYPQIDRVLTNGGTGSWASRSVALGRYARCGGRIIVLAGGGIDEDAIRALARDGCVTEVHVGRAARAGQTVDGRVSAAAVTALKRAAATAPS
jgi:copper homeostasis protein